MQDAAQTSDKQDALPHLDDTSATPSIWVEDGRTLAELSACWRALVKDPLTGLFSRNALLTFTDDAIPYFKRYGRTVGILLLEIDALSTIMETHGISDEGRILRHVAEVLDLSVRTTDKVARFDIKRFVIMLREVEKTDAMTLANRIRRGVEDLGIRVHDKLVPLTVSIGAAIVSTDDMGSDSLIARAESALQSAQNAGGNHVVFLAASSSTKPEPTISPKRHAARPRSSRAVETPCSVS